MATFNILSLCIVTTLLTPFLTHAANYKDGDKVEKSSKVFVLSSNDNLKQSAICRYLCMSTKLDLTSTHKKRTIITLYQCVDPIR